MSIQQPMIAGARAGTLVTTLERLVANNALDETHDPSRRSFVEQANEPATDFPLQNLPLGVYSTREDRSPRLGVAIGDQIFDLKRASKLDLLPKAIPFEALEETSLNALFALGNDALRELRASVADLLDQGASGNAVKQRESDLLAPAAQSTMHRPTRVANYTDFYAGVYHAIAAGALLTPENPLPPNYKWVPIAYHGRASSVQIGQGPVKRPLGQRSPGTPGAAPHFGPCDRLDFELEMGFYVRGGRPVGTRIPIGEAAQEIIGFSLLNDWSARDIQRWEMYPLGPFLSKSFATSVSPWVVTAHALAPFRVPALDRPAGDPKPLGYLSDDTDAVTGGLNVDLEVYLSTTRMREAGEPASLILTSNARNLYWTPAQMVAHHTINGCNLEPGDLIGTGTISGPKPEELGSMLELTAAGTKPVTLKNGEQRGFLLDGDEVSFAGRCSKPGFASIGFGKCAGTIAQADTDFDA
jgi:fumarylacetoacetase